MGLRLDDELDDWETPVEEAGGFASTDELALAQDAGWKDELNLAEFPIAALTDRVPDGQTTLVFEDRLERRDSAPIVRRLTIMGTHKHGLPTSLDDEVLVGLIQITKRRSNFTDPRVQFSRYELIELLGWPRSGQSYRRIEEALHRWVGVLLMYENAWWDNAAKSWVDENFHVLDNVTLYDRERRRPSSRSKSGKGDKDQGKLEKPPLPLSSFKWNDVIFQSFQSGNLKQLDLEFYLRLRLPTTKRMFRFLDKRFYRRSRLDFDLRTLACEHIGMSRSYAPTELKRRLKPALEELEQLGFLEPLNAEERYSYVSRGTWRIILIRGLGARGDASPPVPPARAELIDALKARGVSAKSAADLVDAHPPTRIQTKIEVFDWLIKNEDKRVGKNPAGYLVASIRADYQAPCDFPTAETNGASPAKPKASAADVDIERRRKVKTEQTREAARDQVREDQLRTMWENLPDLDRDQILADVKAANPGVGRWKKMLESLCFDALEARLKDAKAAKQKSLFPDGER